MKDLLLLVLGATVVGSAWTVVNIKARETWLKFISLFSLLLCFGMALAILGKLVLEVLI